MIARFYFYGNFFPCYPIWLIFEESFLIFRFKLIIFWSLPYVILFLLKYAFERVFSLSFRDPVTTVPYLFSSVFFLFPYFWFFLCIYPLPSKAKLWQFPSLIAGYFNRIQSHKNFCLKACLLCLPVNYKRSGSKIDYHFQVSQVSFFTFKFLLKYVWVVAWIRGLLESIVRR